MATEGQRVGVSSMDLWQLCRLYRCEKCAGQAIASYADGEHEECFIFFFQKFQRISFLVNRFSNVTLESYGKMLR